MHTPAAYVGRGNGLWVTSFKRHLLGATLAWGLVFGATNSPAQAFPQSADVGAVGAAGSGRYASGTYTLNGAGADIGGAADA